MVRAVVFDCFGVLTTDGWVPFRRKYFDADPELAREAIDTGRQANAGLISYDDFLERVAGLAGVSASEARHTIDSNHPNTELFDYIRGELKSTYKIGLLSNAGADRLEVLFGRENLQLIDSTSLSYETGFVKPDERAYRDIAGRLGVDPTECIFVDDQPHYCRAAEAAGMRAVVYQSAEQCIRDINALLQ